VVSVTCATLTAIVWGSAGPIRTVFCFEPEPDDPTDSGFSLLRADAPPEPDDETPWRLYCLDCVLDSWPEIGCGLDLAREHRVAELVGGEWRADQLGGSAGGRGGVPATSAVCQPPSR
jgi:hypothetical protein